MGLLTPLAVRVGALPWLPRFLPQIMWLDKRLQRVTRGRIALLDVAGLPNLMLTAIGRKSGRPRKTPLLCVPCGEDILIAGSHFGSDKEPVWVKNLDANPEVTVHFEERERVMFARELTDGDRDVAWKHMLKTWPNFARYEKRTDRTIRVFLLSAA